MATAMIRCSSARANTIVDKLLFPIRTLYISTPTTTSRPFIISTDRTNTDVDQERGLAVDRLPGDTAISRRRGFDQHIPFLFSDVFDPFYPSMSLSQLLSFMDSFMESPFEGFSRGVGGGGMRRGWDAREDNEGLYLRVYMPGLDKEDVKVTVDQSTLVIRGECGHDVEQEGDVEDSGEVRRYSARIDLPEGAYSTDQIKAEMKNGVLKVFVPKIKEEERKDVVHVKVE